MKEFKGTKGEWNQSHRISDKDGNYSTEVYCDKGDTIATLSWYPNNDIEGIIRTDREHNAKIIASSPELLEALQKAKKNIEDAYKILESKSFLCSKVIFEIIDKAINKALN